MGRSNRERGACPSGASGYQYGSAYCDPQEKSHVIAPVKGLRRCPEGNGLSSLTCRWRPNFRRWGFGLDKDPGDEGLRAQRDSAAGLKRSLYGRSRRSVDLDQPLLLAVIQGLEPRGDLGKQHGLLVWGLERVAKAIVADVRADAPVRATTHPPGVATDD